MYIKLGSIAMTAYVPIVALQKNKPYQITRFNEWGDNFLLYLRGY